jgi:hypothetical protein
MQQVAATNPVTMMDILPGWCGGGGGGGRSWVFLFN